MPFRKKNSGSQLDSILVEKKQWMKRQVFAPFSTHDIGIAELLHVRNPSTSTLHHHFKDQESS